MIFQTMQCIEILNYIISDAITDFTNYFTLSRSYIQLDPRNRFMEVSVAIHQLLIVFNTTNQADDC